MTLLYFSTGLRFILLNPSLKTSTTDIIVAIVTAEKSTETRTRRLYCFGRQGT